VEVQLELLHHAELGVVEEREKVSADFAAGEPLPRI
jgi:hypothetical protein